jgi:hypothetical protein
VGVVGDLGRVVVVVIDAVLCMFAGRVYFCRYCYVMVCYVQVRVRSSSGCMYGADGVAAVEAAGSSP